jgi:hypothetical protein
MSIKFASYAAFAAAEKQVSREMLAAKVLYSAGSGKAKQAKGRDSGAAIVKAPSHKKGAAGR